MIVSILIPVCSRNQQYLSFDNIPFMKQFYPSFLSTKSSSITYNIYIGYDDDDTFYIQNIDKFRSITENVICLKECQHAPAKAWNELAKIAYPTSDYLFQIGDDVVLESPGWTEHFIKRLTSNNNIGVVGPCNLINYTQRKNAGRPFVIENSFVSKKHFEIFGYFFHPSIKNWFCDDWITRIYDKHLSEIQLNFRCSNTIVDCRYKIEQPTNFAELVNEGISKIKFFNYRKALSYCVYGAQKKYCLGMVKNLEQIKTLFPEYNVLIYLGNDVPQEYIDIYKSFENVTLIFHDFTGGRLMSYRYFTLNKGFDIVFVRDADSRFGERDMWCITNFIASQFKIFTIRDHPLHGRQLMGGQSGFKFISFPNIIDEYNTFLLKQVNPDRYYNDQDFIDEYIFKLYKKEVIAYSDYYNYGEGLNLKIAFPRKSPEDFCGNVYLFDKDDTEYTEFTIHGKK